MRDGHAALLRSVDQRGLLDFYGTVAKEGGLPMWLYHQPGETKLTIEPDTVAEFARVPGIVGLKVSAGADLLYYHRIVRRPRGRAFRVMMGEDFNCLSAFVLGGHGAVATLANILPDEFVGLWKAVKGGDLATARFMQDRTMDARSCWCSSRPGAYRRPASSCCRTASCSEPRGTGPLQGLSPQEAARLRARAKAMRLR